MQRKTGYLKKEGGSNKTWKKRFIELNHSGLFYFTKDDKKEQKRSNPY